MTRESLAAPTGLDAGLLAVALLGVSFSGPLMAATAAPAVAIAFWRNAMGAGVAGLFSLRRRSGVDRRAVWAGVALAVHFATWVPSLTMTTVASATALVCTQTVFVGLIAVVSGRSLPRAAWTGIVLATLGAALVTGADLGLSSRALLGDLLATAGGLAAAVYVTIGAKARRTMDTATYTAVCYSSCAVLLLLGCLLFGVRLGGYSGDAWLELVLVTVCAQLLGHSLINLVLRSVSPTVVSLAILFEVPGATIVALVWLHQRPPYTALPGIALLLAGLVVVARAGGRDHAPVEVD